MSTALEIRKPELHEWEKLKNLRLMALKTTPSAFSSSFEETKLKPKSEWLQKIQESLTEQTSITLVAVVNEEFVGSVTGYWELRVKTKHVAGIAGMFVDPAHQGKGIGTKLMQEILDKLKNKGKIKAKLDVTFGNPAIFLYTKVGFYQVGKLSKETLVAGKYFDVVLMEKML